MPTNPQDTMTATEVANTSSNNQFSVSNWPFDVNTHVYQWTTYPYCTHGGLSDYSIEDLALELSRRIKSEDDEKSALKKLLQDIKDKL